MDVSPALARLAGWVPQRLFSTSVGLLARAPLPRASRERVLDAFARRLGADVDEAEKPLLDYPTLDAFFTRRLKSGLRPLDPDPSALICPCDGAWQGSGTIRRGRAVQVKGVDYGLDHLLHDTEWPKRLEGGVFATIYLSPRDYHRVHMPCAGELTRIKAIDGEVFPVGLGFDRRVRGLFARNARKVFYCQRRGAPWVLTMVAALGVSEIEPCLSDAHLPAPFARGDEAGAFHLGSTVVLLFPPGATLAPPPEGAAVKLGERIGVWPEGTAEA